MNLVEILLSEWYSDDRTSCKPSVYISLPFNQSNFET